MRGMKRYRMKGGYSMKKVRGQNPITGRSKAGAVGGSGRASVAKIIGRAKIL